MVKHIVFFKFKEPKAEHIAEAKERLMSMEGKIAELKHIEVGVDFMKSDRSYDLALITHFESREDLQTYATHPEHLPILAFMKEIIESAAAVDYEI